MTSLLSMNHRLHILSAPRCHDDKPVVAIETIGIPSLSEIEEEYEIFIAAKSLLLIELQGRCYICKTQSTPQWRKGS